MTHTNCTKNLLKLEDPNIILYENFLEFKNIKGIDTNIIHCFLTYTPLYCDCCGIKNESPNDIIKWGYKRNCKVKIPKIVGYNSILYIDKQRFFCKHCNNTFIASTSLVDKYKNISNNSELQIKLDLLEKSSEKDIAKRNNVSLSKVNKVLDDISRKTVLAGSLPSIMNFDEFMSTNHQMAFIITNNISGQIFDILDNRKTYEIEKYFKRYQLKERRNVKLVCTDLYSPCITLISALFPNAKVVIDRFHIVTQAYRALNSTRVYIMKHDDINYNKFKKYWKLLLKNKNDLNNKDKHFSKNFNKEISEYEIVDYLLNTNSLLKDTYDIYQNVIISLQNKDLFLNTIYTKYNNISDYMKKAIKTYNRFEKYILNSFDYELNNGIIEGTNNLIKCIKRISFGYKSFPHFKARILLIKGLVKIVEK